MMKQLRSRKTMRRILQVTLILVIPSFVVFYGWGSGSGQQGAADGSGTVFASIKSPTGMGRVELTTQDWVRAKNRLVNEVSGQLGRNSNINPNQIEQAIPRKQIAQEAVNQYALTKIAEDMGFQVTQGELSQMVAQAFPGQSVAQIRAAVENYYRVPFRQWLQDTRRSQRLSKAQLYVQAAAHATLPELWRTHQSQDTKVALKYLEVPVFDRKDGIEVSEEDIKKEFEKRREELKVPNQAVYEYVDVSRTDLRQSIQVTDEEARARYEEVKEERYKTPGQATIRHVLIQIPADAPADVAVAARERVDQVYQKARAGAPLSELANQYSEDPLNTKPAAEGSNETVKLGGLLPSPVYSNQAATWGKDFIDAVFSIAEDTVSSPVLTNRGWTVFEVVSRTQPKLRPFDEVKQVVESQTREDKLARLLDQKRAAFETARKNQTTLEGMAKVLHSAVKETSPTIVGSDAVTPLGSIRDYVSEVADLQPGGEPTGVIETSNGYAVLQMKELIPAHLPTLAEVRSRLVNDLQNKKALEEAVKQAKSLMQKVNGGDNLTSLALEMELNHGKTDEPFSLQTASFPYSQMQDLAAWVLLTPDGKTFTTEGFKFGDVPRNLYVCQVVEKIAPERDKFLENTGQIEVEALFTNQQVFMNGYLQDARQGLQPKYNEDIVAAE